ncbi:MAG: DNA-formamidopyrimidine glycosylase family protein [Actinomycetota bacterium]
MPELSEMQALAERLEEGLAGGELRGITPLQFSARKTALPAPEDLVGRGLDSVGRRGKYLVWTFGDLRLLIHLSQGGRVDVEDPPKSTKPKGAVLRLEFVGRPSVLIKEYGSKRRAGWWLLGAGDEGPLAKLGPEPDAPAFAVLARDGDDRRRLHTFLRDQRTVAGIGRGYADDILHAARLSPFQSLAKLDVAERDRLLAAIDEILGAALATERARSGGLPAKLSDRFAVHGRAGRPCPRCGDDLRRVSYESHEIVYCPTCQTNGSILADRRMSRLLR